MAIYDLLDIDPNENIILDIRRIKFGLYFIYGLSIFIIIMVLALLFVAVGSSLGEIPASILGTAAALVIVVVAIVAYAAGEVYKGNHLVITNENIIQVLQFSLLNKQVSQLNLAKNQDVSVDQTGLLQTFMKYGTIEIETAGEASNFKFPFVDDPNKAAKIIIEAHEDFVRNLSAGHSGHGI
jgi:hypothetical protein